MIKLPLSELSYRDVSVDPIGKIFFYKNRVLRAIYSESVDFMEKMFISGFISELINNKMIPNTWIADITIEGFGLVLGHEKIEDWNYPYEWSFNMLKDAAETIIRINQTANSFGYEIMDPHAYNIVFRENKPLYVDLGSFIKYNSELNTTWGTTSYDIFYKSFIIPLDLWSRGYIDMARSIFLMKDYPRDKEYFRIIHPLLNSVPGDLITPAYKINRTLKSLSLVSKSRINEKISSGLKRTTALYINRIFKSFKANDSIVKKIASFKNPKEYSQWASYHNGIDIANGHRFSRISSIINSFEEITSMVEVGANQGKFSTFLLKNTNLKKIIATDYDVEAVDVMYIKNKGAVGLSSLLFDLVRTNGRIGDRTIHDRLKADIVMGLAITHHLILTQGIPLEFIFGVFKQFTNRFIIIEYMPMGLYGGDLNAIPPLPDFYTLDWFRKSFCKEFTLILDELLEPNRHVFVGELKNQSNLH